MAVPANFPIFANLPTGLNPLSLFDTAFGMILNGSAPVPIGSIAVGTTTVSGGTNGQVLYNNNGLVGNTNQPVLNLASSTGLPIATGVSGLGAGIATFLATPTSANLAAALTDETGSGAAVFANSPALAGVPTAPTAAAATNTTQIATTAFVQTNLGSYVPLAGGTMTGALVNTNAAAGVSQFQAISTDAGAAAGPIFEAYRNSASPAAADILGQVLFSGQNSTPAKKTFALLQAVLDDPVATTEDGHFDFQTAVAGALASRLGLGAGLYTAGVTGGDKGAGTINAANYYVAGLLANPGLVFLAGGSGVSGATLDIVLTNYTAYRGLRFVLNLIPATNGSTLGLRVSSNAGVSYDAGAGNYIYSALDLNSGTSTAQLGSSAGDTVLNLNPNGSTGNGAAQGITCIVDTLEQNNSALFPKFIFQSMPITSATATQGGFGSGFRAAAQVTNAIRFLFSSGNIASGTYAVYGYM